MKLICFLVISLLLISEIQGQTTFNKRLHFDFPAAVLTSVIATDSCYYATGIIADSIAPYNTGNIFAKFDFEGNPMSIKTLRDSLKSYETWRPTLIETLDGNFAVSGYLLDSTMRAILIKYSINGDTVFTNQFVSLFHPQEIFITPKDMVQTLDSGFVFLSSVTNPNGTNNGEIHISKIDKNGLVEWQKFYGGSLWDDPFALIQDDDGYVIGAVKGNFNVVNNNYTSRSYIFKIDFEGEIIWEYLSPINENELFDGANDIVKHPNDGWIVLTRKGVEDPINANQSEINWNNYIFSLREDRTLRWGTFFRDSFPKHIGLNYLNKIIPLQNSQEFVAVGNIIESRLDNDERHNGLLVKLSASGDSLWARYFHFVESALHRHYLYDVKQTIDGGFIMVGQAQDAFQSPQGQQAWLLKVDEFGCLIPGCHLLDAVEEEVADNYNISIYPNPTSDYLNFYFDSTRWKGKTEFRIINVSGQIINSFEADDIATTYIVPVYDYPPGIYFLQVMGESELISTEQFVISK